MIVNMYEKNTLLCLLILFVIARSEEFSTAKNVETTEFSGTRLSTVPPYSSLYNDEHLVKDNSKRSLILLMPLSKTRNEHEKQKETIQKTKRCGIHRKNRFLERLSTKEDSNEERTINKNINVGISKQNLNDHTITNVKYPQQKASKRMLAETRNDEMLLRALKDNLNAEDIIINLKPQEKAKKCNTEKYICHCTGENCFSSSSKKSSSGMLGSSRIDKSEKTNRKLTKYENAKSDTSQQKSSILHHESPHKLPFPNLINYFPIQSYQEKLNVPSVPVLYGIIPNVLPHIVGDERKYINVGIPFTSFESKPNYLVGNNQYESIIHQKPCICSSVTKEHQVESSISVTSPSTNYDATTIRKIMNDLESNELIDQTEDQKRFSKLTTEIPNVDSSADSETETNLHLNYSTDVTEESIPIGSFNLNAITPKSEEFSEQTERNSDNNLSKLMTYSTDYTDTSSVPSFIYDGTNNGKLINMKECIQLFGRDVCVLSATSSKMLAKQVQENNSNKYSTIRIPEYVTQLSARKKMLNNIDYSDKFKTDQYFASGSSTDRINKSNINLTKYLESTNAKSNSDVDKTSLREFHPESIEQISESDFNYDKNKSFSTVKNTYNPIKKLINPTIDETAETKTNKLLGKSKSHITKLLLNPNDEKMTNSTSHTDEKFLYSTPSYKSSRDEEADNLKINQQNQVTNINSNSNISPKEETTVINYNFKADSKDENRNESNTDIYSGKKIPQEHIKEETTTTSFNSKTGYNFEEVTQKEIETNVHLGEISQELSTTMQYFDDKESSNLNHKENTTTNNFRTLIDSSTNRLPFCDNTLLLNSIRKVINDFALDPRLTKLKDFDENILQTQGKNLLPEILQVPNLKNILSMPQIENTIVEKVKDVLSYVTAISRRDFTNDWSHGVIKNTLHSILDALSGFHHKLPPMTLEEHQFKDGQWKTNLVTLAPISNQKLSKGTPEHLRENIKDLLSCPAIASQTNQHIVRNMIVQSVKNSLTNEKDDKIDDSIIYALNDILRTLKNSKNYNSLRKNNEVISDEENMDVTFSQEIPTNNYEIGINNNSTLNNKQKNLDIQKDKIDSIRMQTGYQKAKMLENNAKILTTSEFPHLLQLFEGGEETTNKAVAKIKENIKDFGQIKNIDMQDGAEKKLVESSKPKITYHKAILQNNPNVLATLESNSTGTEQYIKNHYIDEENIKEAITNFVQETLPNYAQLSDGIKNMERTKNIGEKIKYTVNEKTLNSTEIDPLIILERIKFNLPPIKYYSPEILKYATNHHTNDKNIEITTASTNLKDYAQMSNSVILQNITKTKDNGDKMEYPLTTTSSNLISSTNVDKYIDYKPKIISLTGENILESQQNSQQNLTEDNIIKIHEVTTEFQRTYAKTTYLKTGHSSDNSPKINSSSLTYKITDVYLNNDNKANDNGNNNNNLIGNKINNIDNDIKTKKVITPLSKSSAGNDIDLLQLFPSSIVTDDILELQRSQLYYISDGVKLPLEIKKLEDGSYALSISKNICKQILTRKCSCCVPLQGYIVRLSNKNHQQEDIHAIISTITEKKDQENMYARNIKKDYQSVQPFNTMITRRRATQKSKEEEEKEEKINAHHPWKQNENLATFSMPVIDFAKKYNLLLDFNEEKVFNEVGLQNKIQNYDMSLIESGKSEHDQSEEKNLNNYSDEINTLLDKNNDAIDKFQDLINVREKKNTANINFPIFPINKKLFNLGKNSEEFEVQKINAKMNQSEIEQESKLHEAKTASNVQNMNIVQKMNSEEREKTNSVLKEINISKRSNISKEKMRWDTLSDMAENTKIFRKEENRESETTELTDNEYNVPEINDLKKNIGKSYRYQRNTNDIANKRTELVKSMLYWLKGLFVDK